MRLSIDGYDQLRASIFDDDRISRSRSADQRVEGQHHPIFQPLDTRPPMSLWGAAAAAKLAGAIRQVGGLAVARHVVCSLWH
jgi:hypothetical protein